MQNIPQVGQQLCLISLFLCNLQKTPKGTRLDGRNIAVTSTNLVQPISWSVIPSIAVQNCESITQHFILNNLITT